MQQSSAYHTVLSKHDTSTQCWLNAGPPSPALTINHSTLDSAFCWRWCVQGVQADTDPMSVKCWASAKLKSTIVEIRGEGVNPYNTEILLYEIWRA